MLLKQELLDVLACPKCKGPVTQDQEREALICEVCALRYPVRDGIPVMLGDEAESI